MERLRRSRGLALRAPDSGLRDPRAARALCRPPLRLVAHLQPHRGAWVGCELRSRCDSAPGEVAELDVVDVLGDGRVLAADRAGWVALHDPLVECRVEGVEEEQPTGQRLADAEDQLQRLACLE